MTSPVKPPTFSTTQLAALVALAVAVVCVLMALVYLIYSMQRSAEAAATPLATFELPTAAVSPTPAGPPLPEQVLFTALEPMQGYSDCEKFGVRGTVSGGNSQGIEGVQIVVWSEQEGLLALADTDEAGDYSALLAGEPAPRQLWAQVFENDAPVSRPVLVPIQVDCQTGFQIYQLDWQALAE